ncbi:MAG: hypothetical protein ACXVDF_07930 [Ktedonobacterales bacterium]
MAIVTIITIRGLIVSGILLRRIIRWRLALIILISTTGRSRAIPILLRGTPATTRF